MCLQTTFLSVFLFFSNSSQGNRAACFLSLNKTARALQDSLRVIQLNPQFPRGYCRAGKCYFLMGDLANARVMYSKGLELASRSDSRTSTGHEDPRYIECLSMLNQIQEVETALHSLPATLETPDDVRHAIRVYLAVQSKCSCWREMYLTLSRDYLLLNDLASAELLLSRITPQLLPGFHDSTIYPFSIAAWDAEKLDIFGNDVSAVDEEIVQRWIELFVLQNRIQRADWLLQKCSVEPRFRETQRNSAGLAPFWGIGELEVRFSGLFF